MQRLVTTVQIRNNPTSVPPLELILKTNGKTFRGIAVAGMFLIASGGAPDYTYAASGLPAGLSLNAATGEITGVPATIGHNVISATTTDSSTNTQTQDFTIDVISRLVVKAGTPPEAETLFAYGGYDFQVENATGAVTWAITSGSLPTGLSLSGGGHLSGTATVTGTFNAVATATDAGSGDTLDVPFAMFVETGFHFTSLNVRAYTLVVGVPFIATQNGYLNGVTPFASAIFGSWPTGLSATFDTNTHSVTYLAKQRFNRQNVQFDSVDALGNTPAFHGTTSLEAIDPNKEMIFKDEFGDIEDPNPGTLTIKSTDNSITVDTSASVGTNIVYDLSANPGDSSGPTGASLYYREDSPYLGSAIVASTGDDTLTLDQSPFAVSETTLKIYIDGSRLIIGTDITFVGLVGTLATSCSGGEIFEVEYWSTAVPGASVLSASGGGDPLFASVSSLVHGNGVNNGTSFPDIIGNTWSQGGSAKTSTAQSIFNGSSILFAGAPDFIFSAPSNNWDMGTADFCEEFSVRFNSTGRQYIMDMGTGTGFGNIAAIIITPSSGLVEIYNTGPGYLINAGSTPFSTGVWYRFAFERVGNAWTLYVDGTAYVTNASDSRAWGAAIGTGYYKFLGVSGVPSVGADCYFAEYRLTKAHRYNGPYTPSGPFPDSL